MLPVTINSSFAPDSSAMPDPFAFASIRLGMIWVRAARRDGGVGASSASACGPGPSGFIHANLPARPRAIGEWRGESDADRAGIQGVGGRPDAAGSVALQRAIRRKAAS